MKTSNLSEFRDEYLKGKGIAVGNRDERCALDASAGSKPATGLLRAVLSHHLPIGSAVQSQTLEMGAGFDPPGRPVLALGE